MFEAREMKEAVTGRIEVDDIEPAVFRQLLQFIYTGNVCRPRLLLILTNICFKDKRGQPGSERVALRGRQV
jgi:hypothetical protein